MYFLLAHFLIINKENEYDEKIPGDYFSSFSAVKLCR